MTTIAHKDGANVLESFAYLLDDVGNINKTTHADGAYWDYVYDGRYRLTDATRYNKTTSPTIEAGYAYTYDEYDNMSTKTAPFEDDFNDGDYTGWSVTGSWSAADYTMKPSIQDQWRQFRRSNTDADLEIQFSYMMADQTEPAYRAYCRPRDNPSTGEKIEILIYADRMVLRENDGSGWTTFQTNASATTTEDTWYDVRVAADGSTVKVYRGERGGAMTQVLSTSSATVTDTERLFFQVYNNSDFRFDNIRVLSDDLSESVTYAHNDANELTSMSDVNGTTSFTYDDWGRTATKSRSSLSATYAYRYGHKLYDVDSNFPDEGDVTYETGGDGKRRSRVAGADETWYDWAGLQVINEEDDAVGDGSLTRTYTGRTFAHVDGSSPSSGNYTYYTHDYLGSVRAIYDQSKDLQGSREYSPYGSILTASNLNLTNRGFTGHDWDTKTGMYFAPYRYFSPSIARWTTRDPLGMVDGPNLYAYVGGNPVNWLDPLGFSSRLPWFDRALDGLFGNLPDGFNDWFGGSWGGLGGGLDCVGNCLSNDCPLIRWPNGGSIPIWPVIPKKWVKWLIPRQPRFPGSSDWTTIPEIINARFMPGGWMGRLLRGLSKWSPWITGIDGIISWGRIGRCIAKCL